MKSKVRDSGLELLRIIMMLQIIFLHVCDKGGYSELVSQLTAGHQGLYYMVWLLSRCPVYVFFILTGYFLIKKDITFKDVVNRIKKIYLPMIFFSIAIPAFGLLFNFWEISDINIPKTFFPFLSKTWYFLTGYIVLVILSPFLNKLAKNLTKKQYLSLLLILLFLFSIWRPLGSLKPFSSFISTDLLIVNQGGKSLYDYIFMYLLGGFLSTYMDNNKKLEFKYLFYFLFLGIVQFTIAYLVPGYKAIAGYNDNLFAIAQCICLIMFFKNLKFQSKLINYIASYTLAIYIIHEHYLLRTYIWNNIFTAHELSFYTGLYPLKILGICFIVFIACMIIEFIRRCLFKFFEKLGDFIKRRYSSISSC